MSKSSLSPLSKDQYYRACLLRHPRLRDELTRFHQEYPRLFARSATGAPPRRGLPAWAQPLIHHQGPTAVAVIPRHTDDLPSVYGVLVTMAVRRAGYDTEILPEEHGYYAELMQIEAGAWQRAWDGMRHQWPQVPEPFLRYCQLSDVNRPNLVTISLTPVRNDADCIA